MARKSEDTVEAALCHFFPSGWLTKSTRATGLVQRQRKVDPISLFWTLVLSFGLGRKNGLTSLRDLNHYVGQSTHQTGNYVCWWPMERKRNTLLKKIPAVCVTSAKIICWLWLIPIGQINRCKLETDRS